MFPKTISVLWVVFMFAFVSLVSANAGLTGTYLRLGGDWANGKACERVRRISQTENITWKTRLNYWHCFPELIDPE
jgi:hypothetical protein